MRESAKRLQQASSIAVAGLCIKAAKDLLEEPSPSAQLLLAWTIAQDATTMLHARILDDPEASALRDKFTTSPTHH
jgi:hypothetical protein